MGLRWHFRAPRDGKGGKVTNKPKKSPPGAGKSSFELIDSERLFSELRICSGMTLLDLGSGKGPYSIEVSRRVGDVERIVASHGFAARSLADLGPYNYLSVFFRAT